jgi:hypothetical protein
VQHAASNGLSIGQGCIVFVTVGCINMPQMVGRQMAVPREGNVSDELGPTIISHWLVHTVEQSQEKGPRNELDGASNVVRQSLRQLEFLLSIVLGRFERIKDKHMRLYVFLDQFVAEIFV